MEDRDLDFVAIRETVTPDWDAATRDAASYRAEDKEALDTLVPLMPTQDMSLAEVRDALTDAVAALRSCVDRGHRAVAALSPGGLTVYVVDGELDSDLHEQFQLLRLSGVLVNAGFEDDR
jgi:hypothetical protein